MSHETEPRTSTPTPNATEVRNLVHPDRKPSMFEKLDTRGKKFGAAAGILALGATLGFGGMKALESTHHNNIPTPDQPTAEAPVVPGAPSVAETSTPNANTDSGSELQKSTEAKQSYQEFIDSFAIKKNVGSFDAIAQRYVSNYQNWLNAGLTEQYDVTLFASGGDNQKAITNVESKFDSTITNTIYLNTEQTQSFIQKVESGMRNKLIDQFIVSDNLNSKNKLAVTDTINKFELVGSDSKDVSTATYFVAKIETNMTDNGTESGVAAYRASIGAAADTNVTNFEQVNFVLDPTTQTWKVSDIEFYAPSIDNSK